MAKIFKSYTFDKLQALSLFTQLITRTRDKTFAKGFYALMQFPVEPRRVIAYDYHKEMRQIQRNKSSASPTGSLQSLTTLPCVNSLTRGMC
jgi:hypothetical protein